jgi:hypothetical protein
LVTALTVVFVPKEVAAAVVYALLVMADIVVSLQQAIAALTMVYLASAELYVI